MTLLAQIADSGCLADLSGYVSCFNGCSMLNKPDRAVPVLKKPVSKPLTVGPVLGTPVFPMPEIAPLNNDPPLAWLKRPEIPPAAVPVAVLKKPETPSPVLLKPELTRPLSVVDPMLVFTSPEFHKLVGLARVAGAGVSVARIPRARVEGPAVPEAGVQFTRVEEAGVQQAAVAEAEVAHAQVHTNKPANQQTLSSGRKPLPRQP